MKNKRGFFSLFCGGLLTFYTAASYFGWEPGPKPAVRQVAKSVRQAPGGYRSYVYWGGGK